MTISNIFSIRFVRFIFTGGINTIVTYALFLFLAHYIHYEVAYLVAYASGIVGSYVMNTYLVFRRPPTGYTALGFLAIYGVQYLYGSALLWVLIDVAGLERHVAAAILVVSSAVLSYLLLRVLFRLPKGNQTNKSELRLRSGIYR